MLDGGEWTVTGTATTIAAALSITDSGRKAYKQIVFRVEGANPVYVGRSNVTTAANRILSILTTDTEPTDIGSGDGETLNIDNIFVIGTAAGGNILHIGLIN